MSNINHVTSYLLPSSLSLLTFRVTLVAIRPTPFACKPQTGLYQEELILCIGLIKLFSYVSLASFSYRSAVYYFTSAFRRPPLNLWTTRPLSPTSKRFSEIYSPSVPLSLSPSSRLARSIPVFNPSRLALAKQAITDPFSVRVVSLQASDAVTISPSRSLSLRIAALDLSPSPNSHERGLTTTFAPPLETYACSTSSRATPIGKPEAEADAIASTWHRSTEGSHPVSPQWARLSQHRINHKKPRNVRRSLGVSTCQQPY